MAEVCEAASGRMAHIDTTDQTSANGTYGEFDVLDNDDAIAGVLECFDLPNCDWLYEHVSYE